MRRSLALLLPAVLFAAACAESPTAATQKPSVRYDGGLFYGSGNVVDGGVNTMGSGNVADPSGGGIFIGGGITSSAGDERGGNYHGSGNLVGGGPASGEGTLNETGPTAAVVDSATATGRGGNYFGSGN